SASVEANPIISTLPGSDRKSPSRSRIDAESSTRKTRRHGPRGSVPSGVSDARKGGRPSPDFGVDALPMLLYEPILYRVIREIGVRLRVHLFENPRAIRADRLVAEKQLRGDVSNRPAGSQLAEHLKFAFAQLLVRGPVVAADIV